MATRNPELPEGTDHIINGAMETNGSGGGGAAGVNDRAAGSAFVGSGEVDDTGGTRAGGTDMADNGGNGGVMDQLRTHASSLRDQAGGRARELAETGKTRATDALDEVSRVVSDAADSIDERLGAEIGEYARRAADAVSDLADSLRNKDVDELYEDARSAVRKSPGIALATAAVVGFALVRLVKAGLPPEEETGATDGRSQPSPGA